MHKQTPQSAFMTGVYAYLNGLSIVILVAIVGITQGAPIVTLSAIVTLVFSWAAMFLVSGKVEVSSKRLTFVGALVIAALTSAVVMIGLLVFALTMRG